MPFPSFQPFPTLVCTSMLLTVAGSDGAVPTSVPLIMNAEETNVSEAIASAQLGKPIRTLRSSWPRSKPFSRKLAQQLPRKSEGSPQIPLITNPLATQRIWMSAS